MTDRTRLPRSSCAKPRRCLVKAGGARSEDSFPPVEPQRLLHELQVHQIEREMQNEELRRAQGELEASRARFFDMYDLAPVGYLTIGEQGLIREANLTAAALFGAARGALVGQPLSRFILPKIRTSTTATVSGSRSWARCIPGT